MKKMIERKKNQSRIELILEEKTKEEIRIKKEAEDKLNSDINGEAKVEVLSENVIKVDDDDDNDDDEDDDDDDDEDDDELLEDDSNSDSKEDQDDQDDDVEMSNEKEIELENEEDDDDDDEFYGNDYHLYDSEGEEEEEDDDEFDFEDEISEEEMLPREAIEKYSKDEEMDPRLLYFFVDCDEEELKELSEEDRKIIEAYRNSQKNTEVLRASKKLIVKNRKLQIANNKNLNNSNNITKTGVNSNNTNSNNSDKLQQAPSVIKNEELLSGTSKRKGSVNSTGSNNTSQKRKRKVSFKTHSNQFNEYDMLKPIILASKRKMNDLKTTVVPKGSLRIKNKTNK